MRATAARGPLTVSLSALYLGAGPDIYVSLVHSGQDIEPAPGGDRRGRLTTGGPMNLSRRDLLRLGGAALAGGPLAPALAHAQTPKRGGTLTTRGFDPPHFDPMLTSNFKTHSALSFTHSRLVRHKAGPAVTPGSFPIE